MPGQLGQVDPQAVVAERGRHHVGQLLPLRGRERAHQRADLVHLLGELVEDVLHRAGAGEEVAVLVQEVLRRAARVRVLAVAVLLEQLVEVAHHIADAFERLGRHSLDRALEVLEERPEHRLLEPLHQLLEVGRGLRVHEVVVLQRLEPLAGPVGQLVQLLLVLAGDPLERLEQLRRRAARLPWLA